MLTAIVKRLTLIGLVLSVVLAFSACTKEEVIPGNQPPPDSTINSVTKENYVNRLYISILGRECSQAEFDEAYGIIDANNLSLTSRQQVFDIIAAKPGYYERLLNLAEGDYLDGADSVTFSFYLAQFQFWLSNSAYQALWASANYEVPRLQALLNATNDLNSGTITVSEMHKRCVNNYQYDLLNMGSLNFVNSIYQHFFHRNPTQAEQEAGVNSINGFPSIVFLQSASNKQEFIDLFFASDNYYEGQVRDLFTLALYREPTSAEQTYYTQRYKSSQNYKALHRDILTLDEYVGF